MEDKQLKKGVIYNFIGMFSYLFAQWLITFIIVWICGYKDAGIFSLAMSVCATFYAFAGFGVRNYQASDLKQEFSERDYQVSRIITSILAFIGVFIYALLKKYNFETLFIILVYMFFKLTESTVDVLHGSMQRNLLFDKIGLSFFFRGILSLTTFSITLLITKNLLLAIIAMTITIYLFLYFYDLREYKKLGLDPGVTSKERQIKILLTCSVLAMNGMISSYTAAYPKIVLEQVLGSELLGIYTTYANPAMIIQVAASFLFSPFVSIFSKYYNNKDYKSLITSFSKCFLGIFVIAIIGLIGSTLLGEFAMRLLFGSEIISYKYLLNEMIIVSALTAASWLVTSFVVVIRNLKSLFVGTCIQLSMIMIFTKPFIENYQLSGANYILIITYIILIIFYIIAGALTIKKNKN